MTTDLFLSAQVRRNHRLVSFSGSGGVATNVSFDGGGGVATDVFLSAEVAA
jgi:hypothetical protein